MRKKWLHSYDSSINQNFVENSLVNFKFLVMLQNLLYIRSPFYTKNMHNNKFQVQLGQIFDVHTVIFGISGKMCTFWYFCM